MKNRALFLSLAGFLCLAEFSHGASVSAGKSLFEAGRWRGTFSAGTGTGTGTGETYLVAGLGVGYFLANGLEAGFDGEAWIGASPQTYKLTPGLRYVYSGFERFWPYLGGFYRRTIYDGMGDLNSYGGRYGAYMSVGANAYAGLGGVYEKLIDCSETVYSSCTSTYPEVTFSLSF